MMMQYWWNGADKGQPKYAYTKLSYLQFSHQKYHKEMAWSRNSVSAVTARRPAARLTIHTCRYIYGKQNSTVGDLHW
jgi:hypothetical protein